MKEKLAPLYKEITVSRHKASILYLYLSIIHQQQQPHILKILGKKKLLLIQTQRKLFVQLGLITSVTDHKNEKMNSATYSKHPAYQVAEKNYKMLETLINILPISRREKMDLLNDINQDHSKNEALLLCWFAIAAKLENNTDDFNIIRLKIQNLSHLELSNLNEKNAFLFSAWNNIQKEALTEAINHLKQIESTCFELVKTFQPPSTPSFSKNDKLILFKSLSAHVLKPSQELRHSSNPYPERSKRLLS
jgi:hypothetical protein